MVTSHMNCKPWYAVQTRPKREKASATSLSEKGYEVFYPVRKKGAIDEPLFPTYLFCRANSDTFGRIVTTPGVLRLLGIAGKPEVVPDQEIACVRRVMQAGLAFEAGIGIKAGDRVRINYGPLTGIEGDVVGAGDNRRLAVSLCLLQRSVSVNLEPSWLEPVRESPMALAAAVNSRVLPNWNFA